MRISTHFHLEEFTRSKTAERKGIRNSPGPREIQNLIALCWYVLEPIRKHFGNPVYITSGFRSHQLNKVVGGSKHSQHIKGEAADFVVKEIKVKEVFDFICSQKEFLFDQAIFERKDDTEWIHISLKNNRKEKLAAEPDTQGRMKYRAVK